METISPKEALRFYVKDILLFENGRADRHVLLPFYADGYPGVMFQSAPNGIFLKPKNKKASDFFLYGQTLLPIEMSIEGRYTIIVFQLYPFAAKALFNVRPKELNDDCWDLNQVPDFDMPTIIGQLKNTEPISDKIEILSSFLTQLIASKNVDPDQRVQTAINLIINHKGQVSINELRDELYISERTFERLFIAQVGITPKQFARVIQFQCSLNQLAADEYSRLTDIAFDNGFADQSHFIRAFKQFTGTTPADFYRKNLA